MTARFLRCRGDAMGGASLMPAPGPYPYSQTWSKASLPEQIQGVAANADGSIIVAGANGSGHVYTSTDGGKTYAQVTVRTDGDTCESPVYANGRFFIGGSHIGVTLYQSTDGLHWTGANVLPNYNSSFYFAYGAGVWTGFVTGGLGMPGNGIYSTDEGATWYAAASGGASFSGVGLYNTYDGANFLLPGHDANTNAGNIAYSADGSHWSVLTLAAALQPNKVAAGGGLWFACDPAGHYVVADTFTGLATASLRTLPAMPQPPNYTIAPAGVAVLQEGRIVVCGTYGNVLWSTDGGITWSFDTGAWPTANGGNCSNATLGVFGNNLAAAVMNTSDIVGVRGVMC